MMLTYHNKDFRGVPDEDGVMDALRGFDIPAGDYSVFRLASTTAFIGYALAHAQRSIWFSQNWGTTARNMFDGLVYALLTGGVFGWLWP